ncbi:CAP domain-containing protein [Solirubrobacter soli]|uniref:CAP domain-containing protein n=1 Tax=Solirubrobacter soli TaxID=363832 RepID=UPI0004279A99|nr:CAP domain-containing protein [Solirubrobacter soli]
MSILPTPRGALCAALAAGCVLATPTIARADCADADLYPAPDNLDRVRSAVVCLHNEERAERGLRSLRADTRLRRAAAGHSDEMVEESYFAHDSADGSDFVDRILAARYVARNDGYSLGENLAWGTGNLSTARGVVDAWMRSSAHRANLLKKAYRDIGVGIRLGVPQDAGVGATYTIDFGVRS